MKILMFGWEFPPHISGGLGTACYGLTKNLSKLDHIEILLVLPKVYGDEEKGQIKLINAEKIDIGERSERYRHLTAKLTHDEIRSLLAAYTTPEKYAHILQKIVSGKAAGIKNPSSKTLNFSGKYGITLFEEIKGYAEVASVIAEENECDVIHAHDWLTFQAGIAAKKVSGKPLILHVHATEYDRSGRNINPEIYNIEKKGLFSADKIITVSDYTKNIINTEYGISKDKIVTIHNGIDFHPDHSFNSNKHIPEKVVTYLGRITHQKGPLYFIEAAYKVLQKNGNVRFVMAGTGDMEEKMIQKVAQYKIGDKFHFTGFLNHHEVYRLFTQSDLYIMPSVSEPFGISPLEAIASGVPVIISKQSGVSEVLNYAIKVDFWDIDAMADAIYGVLHYNILAKVLKEKAKEEVKKLTWIDTARKVKNIYYHVIRNKYNQKNTA